jgi:AcrR family transcriptional regulator
MQQRANRTRDDIVAAATEVFARQGYDGASVREIADRAGISKGNLTYYFAVKDDLLFEIVATLHDGFLQLAKTHHRVRPASTETLRAAFIAHVVQVCTQLQATRVSYEAFRYLTADRRATIVSKRSKYERSLQRLIAATCPPNHPATGRMAPVTTRTVLGMLNWPYQWYSPAGTIGAAELAERVAELALRSLAT